MRSTGPAISNCAADTMRCGQGVSPPPQRKASQRTGGDAKKEGGVPLEGRRLAGARLTSRGFGIEQKVQTPFRPDPAPTSRKHNGIVAPIQPHRPCYIEGHFFRDKAITRFTGEQSSDHRSYAKLTLRSAPSFPC